MLAGLEGFDGERNVPRQVGRDEYRLGLRRGQGGGEGGKQALRRQG